MSKQKLRITNVAGQDLDDLYTEGFTTWGEAQADRYYDGLLTRFDRICENPRMYPPLMTSAKATAAAFTRSTRSIMWSTGMSWKSAPSSNIRTSQAARDRDPRHSLRGA